MTLLFLAALGDMAATSFTLTIPADVHDISPSVLVSDLSPACVASHVDAAITVSNLTPAIVMTEVI